MILGGLATVGAVTVADAFWYEKEVIDWQHFDLSTGREDPIKFIQVSDLHLNELKGFHRGIAEQINVERPDLILVTGDAIDRSDAVGLFDEFLALIDPMIPKLGIPGNWEYWGEVDLDALCKVYLKHRGDLLINQHTQLKLRSRRVNVIGLDDLRGGHPDFEQAVTDLPAADHTLVMAHCPAYRDTISNEKGKLDIDLVLSGHTHGGQVNFFGWVPFKPGGSGRYLSGWYEDTEPKMYVSRGIGTSIVPVRFGARAEVAVFQF